MNSIKWNDVTLRRGVMEYYRGLIAVRKFFPQFRMRTRRAFARYALKRWRAARSLRILAVCC